MKEKNKDKKDKASFYSASKKEEEILKLAKKIEKENSTYFYGVMTTGAAAGSF